MNGLCFCFSGRVCDCCQGPMIGEGITLIRPGSLYGVKNVPFKFKSCSHYCAKLFMESKNNLLDMVYLDNSDNSTIYDPNMERTVALEDHH